MELTIHIPYGLMAASALLAAYAYILRRRWCADDVRRYYRLIKFAQ